MSSKSRLGLDDTSPEAERVLIELARQTPVWRKFEQIGEATEIRRVFATAVLRERYPEASEEELRLRLIARSLDRETMIRVYNWDPKLQGY
jgi:hypothetical protein